ncbi:regulatory helix-turn-helix protein, lysR family [Burkholderia sp. GAS332]|nr:regulatory helix-turn-helix protein, lysR family [Burkholderia sp. GAS332]
MLCEKYMSKDVTLRQMRYVVEAAQAGQFSMAAATEHVSQSEISNSVLVLEETLRTRLFERMPPRCNVGCAGLGAPAVPDTCLR